MPAIEIKKGIGKEIWDRYFKFCFVKNYWERIILAYYWDMEFKEKYESLAQFIARSTPNLNVNIYTIDRQIPVNYIGKYESLIEDL